MNNEILLYLSFSTIILSTGIVLLSVRRSVKIREVVPTELYTKWTLITVLLTFFGATYSVLAYMASSPSIRDNVSLPYLFVMSVLLLSGSCYVYLSTRLYGATIVKLNESEAALQTHANNLVEYTQELKKEIVQRQWAEKEITDQLTTMTTIHTINKAITANLDIHNILDELLDNIVSHLGIDAAAVLLFDEAGKVLKFERGKGLKTDLMKEIRVISGESLAQAAYEGKKKFVIPDLRSAGSNFDNMYKKIYNLSDSYLVKEEGFIGYLNIPLVGSDQLLGVLELFSRAPLEPNKLWLKALNAVTGQAAVALYSATQFRMIQLAHREISSAYEVTIEGWARALDYRDRETEGHSRRVCTNSVTLASLMGISGGCAMDIRRGALLHDIGKLGIPDNVLLKPGRFTPEEWNLMRKHPDIGADMLRPIEFLKNSIDIPQYHHEKWDGTGYPMKLRGEEIPLSARIFAIIDVWDALSSDRPYRRALSEDEVIATIKQGKGTHFDPRVVEAFMDALSDSRIVYSAHTFLS